MADSDSEQSISGTSNGSARVAAENVWNEDFYVDLDRLGNRAYTSWIWQHYGSLKNKETGSVYDSEHVYCKSCVEEKHSLKNK